MQMIAGSMKHELHIEVWSIADEKQILINWSLNEMCNYLLIVCSALFVSLLAGTVFSYSQYIVLCTWGHLQMQINTFIEE